jgi:hypothetical protein|uniref:Uncharacterized protein n=1 Tax=Faecalibaculum rodentium TaxID=1702221 RepID=A0A140DSN8_9FIRM|nr:hypothetical protein AALO17_05310 [Faecalibaculum rodentium]
MAAAELNPEETPVRNFQGRNSRRPPDRGPELQKNRKNRKERLI